VKEVTLAEKLDRHRRIGSKQQAERKEKEHGKRESLDHERMVLRGRGESARETME
jgi:hypothetical protein